MSEPGLFTGALHPLHSRSILGAAGNRYEGPRARTPPATLTAAAAAASSLRIPRLGDHEFEVLARHHQRGRARGVHLFEQHGDVTLQRLLPR
jgi:hypothetical protein